MRKVIEGPWRQNSEEEKERKERHEELEKRFEAAKKNIEEIYAKKTHLKSVKDYNEFVNNNSPEEAMTLVEEASLEDIKNNRAFYQLIVAKIDAFIKRIGKENH